MYKPTQFVDRQSFFRGFKDFKSGRIINPFVDFFKSREWQRGQNYAYFMSLTRNKQRESYREQLNRTLESV